MSQSPSEVRLLDCTLRDGGYYNAWDFSTALVQEYLNNVHAAGIHLVELGFRQMPSDRYLGPLAYTTDEYIDSLDVPNNLTLGVMVDAKHLLASPRPTGRVRRLFKKASESRVQLVRIATNYGELERLGPEIDALTQLGYRVGLNLMQISSRTPREIARFGELATEFGVEVAYFADSFGGMQATDIAGIFSALRSNWSGPIGCHMHDHMTLALANTLAAVDAGATWVDGTVLGMGRGPGNARSEYLAIELTRRSCARYDHLPLINLVNGPFAELHGTYGWGSNPYYFLSAAEGVHPTYVQELTRDGRYGLKEVVTALESLRDGLGTSFSRDRVAAAVSPSATRETGTYDAAGWCAGRDVLIVGPGPAGRERRREIEDYIRRTTPVVIALNIEPPVTADLVDAVVVCHPIRALLDANKIDNTHIPIFAPSEVLSEVRSVGIDSRDYGLRVAPDTFSYTRTGCVLPQLEAIGYALALAGAGGASRILLSGFDGFPPGDSRQEAMTTLFSQFAEVPDAPPVISVTRTAYPIQQSSIFAPVVGPEGISPKTNW